MARKGGERGSRHAVERASVAGRNGYRVAFGDIGEPDADVGSSTQMAVLTRAA